MTWQEFEMLVGESFRREGYRVIETGGGGADGGVDLVLSRMGEKFFVQCKQWKAFKVGVDVVRELYGVMAARGAVGGFVVTSGRYSEEAKNFASGRNIRLIDGPAARANSPGPELDRGGRRAGRAAASGNSGAGRGGDLHAELSGLQPADGQAQGEERRQGGRRILGVCRLPGMPGDSADRVLKRIWATM